jgi:hypothetical protein
MKCAVYGPVKRDRRRRGMKKVNLPVEQIQLSVLSESREIVDEMLWREGVAPLNLVPHIYFLSLTPKRTLACLIRIDMCTSSGIYWTHGCLYSDSQDVPVLHDLEEANHRHNARDRYISALLERGFVAIPYYAGRHYQYGKREDDLKPFTPIDFVSFLRGKQIKLVQRLS